MAPGLRAPVALLSCIGDEALYWQWDGDVFEVMNSGTQTHNISGHIPSRLVYSQGLLRRIKQIHLLSPEPFCFLHVPRFRSNVNAVCTFSDLKNLLRCKCCIEMQFFGCDTDSWAMPCACVAGWNTSPALGAIHFYLHLQKQNNREGQNKTVKNHLQNLCMWSGGETMMTLFIYLYHSTESFTRLPAQVCFSAYPL